MAKKNIKTRYVTIKQAKGAFSILKKPKTSKKSYDFSGIDSLRKVLSNERARILDVIKTKQPTSIYQLAKILKRNFKSVNDDVNILKKFGFIELIKENTKKRTRHRPKLGVDKMIIEFRV
jgi:predicted transcriptional regulator